VKIDSVAVPTLPFALFASAPAFDTVEAYGVTIDPDALPAIPGWAVTPGTSGFQIDRLRLNGVKIRPMRRELEEFDADIAFAPNGAVRNAMLKNEKVTIGIVPLSNQARVNLSAHDWRPPIGAPIEFTYLDFSGVVNRTQLIVNDLQARLASGTVTATIVAKWAGPITVEGDFKTENVRLQDVMTAFTSSFSAAGLLKSSGRYTLQSDTLEQLFAAPRIEGTFNAVRGELRSIDLVRTIQASSGTAFRGGRTPFDELAGSVTIAGGRYSYRQIQLTSGALNATGALDISPASEISGQLSAEVGSKGRVIARATVGLSGTLKDPQIKH
jgi:hypothetical protein